MGTSPRCSSCCRFGASIASNIVFMTYGLAGGVYPVFALHVLKVREASRGDLPTEWLIPFMARRTLPKGDVVFRTGDAGNTILLIFAGSVRIVEIGVVLGSGSLVGEMGVFHLFRLVVQRVLENERRWRTPDSAVRS